MRCLPGTSKGLVLLVLLAYPVLLCSQSQITTGTIEGTVTDETGAAVSGARVVLTHVGTGVTRSLSTDTSGRYLAPLLQVGNYEITVQLTGFTTVKRAGV